MVSRLVNYLNITVLQQFSLLFLLIIPLIWILGVNLGYFLGRWMPFFNQFGRFAVIGFTNAAIDFGVLNLLSYFTGIKNGQAIILLNITSFTVAVICSYLFNKYWAFDDNNQHQEARKFTLFLLVSVVGLLINSGIVFIMTTYVPVQFGLTDSLWLNLAKVLASAVGLIWNFVGYKIFVFKK